MNPVLRLLILGLVLPWGQMTADAQDSCSVSAGRDQYSASVPTVRKVAQTSQRILPNRSPEVPPEASGPQSAWQLHQQQQAAAQQLSSSDASRRQTQATSDRMIQVNYLQNDTGTKSHTQIPLPKANESEAGRRSPGSSLTTIFSGLLIVLGLLFLLAWGLKKGFPQSGAQLPADVVEVLGRSMIAPRQYVQLIRCGGRLLLVSVTPSGMQTLAEITDHDEIEQLTQLCRQAAKQPLSGSFRQMLTGARAQVDSTQQQSSAGPDAKQSGKTEGDANKFSLQIPEAMKPSLRSPGGMHA